MTALQKLEIRASEIRQRLSELADVEVTDDIRGELTRLRTEYQDNELKQSAATIAGDGKNDPIESRSTEGREFRALLDTANVGEILDNTISKRSTDGANAEVQQHYGLGANVIPLAMLANIPDDDSLETRAVTPAPGDVGATQASIIPYVFPQAAATYLGVDMPTVGVGEQTYPVLTKQLDVRTPAENAEAAETTGAFSADVLTPSRIQAAFFYSREDRARFAGMDASLRENLSMGLADGLDQQVINGPNGLAHSTNLANHNVTAVTDYALYRSQLMAGRVDGRYASTYDNIRILMGPETYAHADSVWRGSNTNNDVSALDVLMDRTAGVRVSAHIPDADSNDRQNAIVRLGMNRDMVAPIWEGIELIPDEITKAASGQIIVTAYMLHAVAILRSAGWHKQQTQHS